MKIDICIASKDRHTELALLLQSLRTQTYQNFDIYILDDMSGTPFGNNYFLQSIFSKLKYENHRVRVLRNEIPKGVCGARNLLIDETNEFGSGELILRCDDDVILEPDYLEKLLKGIKQGYDAMSGVVPPFINPDSVREVKFVKPIINHHKLDNEGNLVEAKDDCGHTYDEELILPTPHFRTNCLYKKEIQQKIRYPIHLSHTGFREEGFFSFKMILEGYKIGINTQAIARHLLCPSGGVRAEDYSQRVQQDDKLFKEWIKDKFKIYGNFLEEYYKKW